MISGAVEVSTASPQSEPHPGGEGALVKRKPSLEGAGGGRGTGPPAGAPGSPAPLRPSWLSAVETHVQRKGWLNREQTPASSNVTRVSSKPQRLVRMVSKMCTFLNNNNTSVEELGRIWVGEGGQPWR